MWNPPNPYLTEHREWLGEPPAAQLQVYEDESQSILSRNDSPDLGFRWSVNPYRGCFHACAYCLSGDTSVLMADGTTKRLQDLRIGDEIYGTVRRGDYRRYTRTRVLAHWSTRKLAYRVLLEDGTELIASADHRFLTNRGWKHVTGSEQGRARRPHLTPHIELMGTGRFAESPPADAGYRRGYLAGLIRGDGMIGTYSYDGRRRARDIQHHFRLALTDFEALQRARQYLSDFEVATHLCEFKQAVVSRKPMRAIRTHARANVERIRELIEWPAVQSPEWSKGFLAGIFDAEGSYSCGVLRIANTDPEIIDHASSSLRRCGFDCALDASDQRSVQYVRLRGGLREALRFFHCVDPVISRKRDIEGRALKSDAPLRVLDVQPLGLELPMFDITTGTGDFIANGVVSHNCYARPTHEYLGFGAGSDFETRIVIKRQAPALLERAFRRPTWKGERVVFSGVTDCYQPLEAAWKLTRGCLEVCLAFRNPAAIITKSLLIRRDVELLVALRREADVSVAFSIPFLDEQAARLIEPGAPTIRRRFETMRLLAEAGVPVGIGVAPIIPGLNDADIPALLQEAKRCGAQFAFRTLLRLPGSVKGVFFHRLQQAMPLAAARVEHRIRAARGGPLSDSRFGSRHHGQGQYWETIEQLWTLWVRRLDFDRPAEEKAPAGSTFRRPPERVPRVCSGLVPSIVEARGPQLEFAWSD
ncbi:MAG: LAGLIDADG family homing endonuclease [Candidatus Omnitrophota bacterium]|nr:LAGLIDADG family homing endonuclease [Candidatus Omnitrophota bacterium]